MFYHFSNYFKGLPSLQYLDISHNVLIGAQLNECSASKKTLETIDLSFNELNNLILSFDFIFACIKPKKIYLKGNKITSFNGDWRFFDESLRVLDLSQNIIEIFDVSLIFFYLKEVIKNNNNRQNCNGFYNFFSGFILIIHN